MGNLLFELRNRVNIFRSDCLILSYPKCGRTWFRHLLFNIFKEKFALKSENQFDLYSIKKENDECPRILVRHDENPQYKTAFQVNKKRKKYYNSKIIFLIRDPRDVLVSYYFHLKNREKKYNGSLEEFVYEEIGSIKSIVSYFNVWAKEKEKVKDFIIIRYEDLKKDTFSELQRVLNFIDLKIEKRIIEKAISKSSFKNMRKKEEKGEFKDYRAKTANKNDKNAFKVRKGKVGGYKDYLSEKEIDYLDKYIEQNLDDYYDFYKKNKC